MRLAMVLGAGLLLAGCGGGGTLARPVTGAGRTPMPELSRVGLDRVMGQTAAGLTRSFGPPDADAHEGTARKLQFKGPICVLDTYLYPGKSGGEPTVTYVDTRQPDGSPIDRASCVAALARRGGGK